MGTRQAGRRIGTAAAVRRKAARPAGRRQAGRRTAGASWEWVQLLRLMLCGGAFVLLVAAKLLLPGRLEAFGEKLSAAMARSMDVQAVFAAVGGLFSSGETPSQAADEVYRAVFRPEEAESRKTSAQAGSSPSLSLTELQSWRDTAPREGAALPADEEPSREESVVSLILYTDEDLPENVSMSQAILGFDHRTPVKGALSSGFGYREHPTEGEERFHYGVDLAADTGTAIACFADGTVTAVGESSSYGKYCTVTHANGCSTLYAHCSRISVSSGSAVKEGEKLGEVGETGMATGPHLHFELQKDGVYLNPVYYVETA